MNGRKRRTVRARFRQYYLGNHSEVDISSGFSECLYRPLWSSVSVSHTVNVIHSSKANPAVVKVLLCWKSVMARYPVMDFHL
jgi:hypothetical protein